MPQVRTGRLGAVWGRIVGLATLAVIVLPYAGFQAQAQDLLAQITPTLPAEPDRATCFREDPGGRTIGVEAVARIKSSHGTVQIQAAGAEVFRPGSLDAVICPDESLLTGEKSRAAIVLLGRETVLRLDENTRLVFSAPPEPGRGVVDLLSGALHFLSRVERTLDINTPFVNAGVEGTEAYVSVDEDLSATLVTVFEGSVTVAAGLLASPVERGQVRLAAGQTLLGRLDRAFAVATPETVPTRYRPLVVEPRNAVRWAVYYPPVLFGPPGTVPAPLREAASLLNAGRFEQAEAVLAAIPDTPDVEGSKLALRTIIAVAQNRVDEALGLGRRAVAASPRSAAAKIALSYAEQADFELEAARDLLLAAVEDEPDNALAWARLAELWLSLGYAGRSREAATTATMLADIGLTNTILGFAELASLDPAEAQVRFEQALQRDDQNPLTRLGLGLARIRQGELAEGRRELEIAASLDPLSSVVRSYLGKAYFEELRSEPAASQLALARELDPNDPTPSFYDAIRKQTENRPVEALEDLQNSIELNGNRAVYSSRLALDQDLAARQIAQARVYDTLGFDQLAVIEGAKSLSFDPANFSAHRFLSDSYIGRPRHEIARASELLQSQLLQPVNNNPIQPSLRETDLRILERIGPDRLGINEFTSLFERDRFGLDATGLVGNNDTWSEEVVLSGLHRGLAWNLGQFHYQTDGFRRNNDLAHDIYNLFAQASVTEQLDVQVELRRRETDRGDIRLNFDPNAFSPDDRRTIDQDSARLGLRFSPWPHSDFAATIAYKDRDAQQLQLFPGLTVNEVAKNDGFDFQAQYLYNSSQFNTTIGGGTYEIDVDERLDFDFGIPCPIPSCVSLNDFSIKHRTGYFYTDISVIPSMTWTFGLSYDDFQAGILNKDVFSPKVGLQWDITEGIRLRSAYVETFKRTLVVEETIEPTQIAGFNQLFDDFNATLAERYGLGLDLAFADNLFAGVEFSHRDLEVPIISTSSVVFEDTDEDLHRGYVYWAPHPNWAFSAEALFERFSREEARAALAGQPDNVETLTVPVAGRYFHNSGPLRGLFAELGVSYVDQQVDFPLAASPNSGSEDFVLVDAAIGYRFPSRNAISTLSVKNLLDKDFRFQDSNIQDVEPSTPRFLPERTILFTLTLNF